MEQDGSDVDLSDDDLDPLTAEQCRTKLLLLLEERKRKNRLEERLVLKMRNLNDQLAEKRDQVEGLQRTLETEQAKVENEVRTRRAERQKRLSEMDVRIRQYLTEVLFRSKQQPKALANKEGGAEQDQQLAKPASAGGSSANLSMILVSYFKPGTSERCDLRYRVNETTSVRQLRYDSCKYWQLDGDEFVVRTSVGSKVQGDMMVHEIFKDGEIAQVFLLPRIMNNTVVSEAEKKSILPKTGKLGRKSASLEEGAMLAGIGATGEQELRKCGGGSLMVKIAELKPSEYLARIRFRDILVYLLLALMWAWLWLSNQRWPGQSFAIVEDMARVLVHDDFYQINSTAQALVWWQRSYSRFLSPPFTQYNLPFGFLRLRQQKVQYTTCPSPILSLGEALLAGRNCTDDSAPETSGMLSEGLYAYWNHVDSHGRIKGGNYGRGPTPPYMYTSDGKLYTLQGSSGESFDSSGYLVDYNLMEDAPLVATSIEQDILAFHQNNWLDARTRLITWSVTVYNPHYDLFLSLDYILETPPGGQALARIQVMPFRPNNRETDQENMEAATFHIRLLCALYVLFSVIPMEVAARERVYKAGGKYLITLMGIADQMIVLTTFVAYFWQLVLFGQDATVDVMRDGKTQFQHFAQDAERYRVAFEVDGLLVIFLMVRLSRYLAISRRIYLLWKALDRLARRFFYLMAVNVMLLIFWTFLGNTLFGRMYNDEHWHSIRISLISVFRLYRGDGRFLWMPDLRQSLQRDTSFYVAASCYAVCFYGSLVLLLQKTFVALAIESFALIKLSYDPRSQANWNRERIFRWVLPDLVYNMGATLVERLEQKLSQDKT
ncbi:unnamed protein product [Amoebophrya sp. A120]|nr:unnamed protein product [Amoebophrya sp. A120]|eukprot:GSA120T00002437001.1